MITPTAVATSPFKFTGPEKTRLTAAAAELARLDALIEKVVNLKSVTDRAALDFAAGKIDIGAAIALLGSAGDSAKRAEAEGQLRRPLKAAIKQTVASVGDLLAKDRQHHVAELAAKASTLEKGERAAIDALGMNQDDFVPSDLLRGIREQHRRAAADALQAPGRDALNRLLAAANPAPSPRDELASDAAEMAADFK